MDDECTKNKEQNLKKKESYEIIKRLGRGAFGTTYLVSKDKKMYVLKSLRLTPKNMQEVYTEIDVLKRIAKHGCRKDILCYKDQFVNCDDKTLNIVTDAFENAITLTDYIRSYQEIRGLLSRKELLTIMYNVCNALYYLSKIGIAHGDIKPDNILINEKTFDIQIIDFGLSCAKKCRPSGTIMFASPEILGSIGPKADDISIGTLQSADVFSLGVVFYLLANMKLPYSTNRSHQYEFEQSRNLSDISELEKIPSLDMKREQYEQLAVKPIDISNELLAIRQLYNFYIHHGNKIMSMYNDNQSDIDVQINNLIESMLRLDIKSQNGRPSMRTVLAKLKKIMTDFDSSILFTPMTPMPKM